MSSARTEPRRRLFFALWPDDTVREALHQVAGAIHAANGGRPVPRPNIHVTLQFLGNVPEAALTCVTAAAGRVAGRSFTLELDQLVYRKRQHMLWAATAHTPPPLLELAAALQQELSACGLELETRPFRAHVTLLRKLDHYHTPVELPALHWATSRFHLVESVARDHGVDYRLLQNWPLQLTEV